MRSRAKLIWILAVVLPATVLVVLRVGTDKPDGLFAAILFTVTALWPFY
jgi:hypothetical protein